MNPSLSKNSTTSQMSSFFCPCTWRLGPVPSPTIVSRQWHPCLTQTSTQIRLLDTCINLPLSLPFPLVPLSDPGLFSLLVTSLFIHTHLDLLLKLLARLVLGSFGDSLRRSPFIILGFSEFDQVFFYIGHSRWSKQVGKAKLVNSRAK